MEKPPSSDESDVEEHKIDIRAGEEIRIKHDAEVIREPFTIVDHPHIIIETVGKVDNSKLWVSDKEIDATIYLTEKAIETSNCSKSNAEIQYEHQKMNQEMLARSLMSQKMERFLKNVLPIIEEEVRQSSILENLW